MHANHIMGGHVRRVFLRGENLLCRRGKVDDLDARVTVKGLQTICSV